MWLMWFRRSLWQYEWNANRKKAGEGVSFSGELPGGVDPLKNSLELFGLKAPFCPWDSSRFSPIPLTSQNVVTTRLDMCDWVCECANVCAVSSNRCVFPPSHPVFHQNIAMDKEMNKWKNKSLHTQSDLKTTMFTQDSSETQTLQGTMKWHNRQKWHVWSRLPFDTQEYCVIGKVMTWVSWVCGVGGA